ncbi:CU044_2847 family protein [Nonomuraea sp. NPDC059023]|uniref:CU044_2847 family protein n=1 Tax=unclassified Nonomuraea TaxID=2593643 RepID=UPI0036A4292B
MKEYVEIPLADGESLIVESVEVRAGTVQAGRLRDVAGTATETFESAMTRLRSAADSVVRRMSDMARPPDEVTVGFAVKLATQAGVVIANTSAEANLSVTLKWTAGSPEPEVTTTPEP